MNKLNHSVEQQCGTINVPGNGALIPTGTNPINHGGSLVIACSSGYTPVGQTDTVCMNGSFDPDISGTTCGELYLCTR